ncbi:glycosyltransferase family 39 protein [Candidatus Halobeggiatoa sp. HSG11]|nr:glycosyltransferase family 39 protein [Candidatus Halobeggiatoa sp. HSG11]
MQRIIRFFGEWAGLWLLLILIPIVSRTLIQIDETRYVSVAWEMWVQGNWLVPYLNGEAYHHKPPLLFWLINLGWGVFGVNEWWPRLIPGLFSLGNLFLAAHIARILWPRQPRIVRWVPFILLSSMLWCVFTGITMFDMLLTFFNLLGIIAILQKRWGLLGIAIGLGVLTKGPVILLNLLPVALLMPWWSNNINLTRHYLSLVASIIIGALIALTWAIPAGLLGGEEYRQAIFFGQTANRLVNSFAHQQPIWWYLVWFPLALFPLSFWLPTWRGLSQLPKYWHDTGVRFCIIWFVPVFVSFSLISGKQLHYLLPVLPALALLLAYLLEKISVPKQRWNAVLPGITIIFLGFVFLIVPFLLSITRLPQWVANIPLPVSIALIVLGGILVGRQSDKFNKRLIVLSTVTVLVSLIVPLTILQAGGQAYDLRKISKQINEFQQNDTTLAHFGDYHGQYHFLGRLKNNLKIVDEYDICPWLTENPDSKLIVYFARGYKDLMQHADYVQAYRSKHVGIIDGQLIHSVCVKMML